MNNNENFNNNENDENIIEMEIEEVNPFKRIDKEEGELS